MKKKRIEYIKKKEKSILTCMLFSLLLINIDFCSLIDKYKIKQSIRIMEENGTVYIPTFSNMIYYKNPKPENIKMAGSQSNLVTKKIVNAIYALQYLKESEIQTLLLSSYPNIRVFAYMCYVRKTEDLYFDYLLESLENTDTVEYINDDLTVGTYCYVSDILLLIALKALDVPLLLPLGSSFLYELTNEQKEILKKKYEEKRYLDSEIHQQIKKAFEPDYNYYMH